MLIPQYERYFTSARRNNRWATEAARLESVQEIRSAETRPDHGEHQQKMLGILPIPICLLPDENVARYLSRALCG